MNKQAMKYTNVMQINNGALGGAESRSLSTGQIRAVTMGKGRTLTCTSGSLWVTRENDVVDHILRERESLAMDSRGKVVLSGLSTGSSFQIA